MLEISCFFLQSILAGTDFLQLVNIAHFIRLHCLVSTVFASYGNRDIADCRADMVLLFKLADCHGRRRLPLCLKVAFAK